MGLALPLAFVAQTLSSCGSDDDGDTVCDPNDPNDVRACNGPGQCDGRQVCLADGSGYDVCECDMGGSSGSAGAGGIGGGAGTGSGGSDMTPDPTIPVGLVGAPCESTADCSTLADFTCLQSTSDVEFGGGGPEGGYCSVQCTSSDECTALDGASLCGLIDNATGIGYCIGLCPLGDVGAKCGEGDRAQACLPIPQQAQLGICIPMCTSDESCGEGRFCDPSSGLCADAAPVGGPVGAPCTQETQEEDCAGDICLTFSDEDDAVVGSFCSASCTYLSLSGCGYGPESTGPRSAACLQEQATGGGPGDIGLCFELCDVDTDCIQEDWVCSPFSVAVLADELGRQGQCVPPELGDGVADAGPG